MVTHASLAILTSHDQQYSRSFDATSSILRAGSLGPAGGRLDTIAGRYAGAEI
jgi:hypothetical protein